MKKRTTIVALLLTFLFMGASTAFAQELEIAYTYNPNIDERVPLYYEPSLDARLFGEYFNGVEVNILENTSDDWTKIQIVTYPGADGLQMYVQSKYLVLGEAGKQIEKTTMMFEVNVSELYAYASGTEPSIFRGPFGMHEYMELIGLNVPLSHFLEDRITLPLPLETSVAHVRTANISCFLDDISSLKRIEE